jgi:hypothetical protein
MYLEVEKVRDCYHLIQKRFLRRIELDTPSPFSSPLSVINRTRYDNLFVTSSPPDADVLRVANTALTEAIQPLGSPIQNYLNRRSARVQRLEARVIVLEKDKSERCRNFSLALLTGSKVYTTAESSEGNVISQEWPGDISLFSHSYGG